MKHRDYDVVVVGAGHAGCEAADSAARMGARTALVTLRRDDIGVMSCNPAIGGLGKGHLVCEIDALDGLMGRATDAAGIQFRLLNRKKGPAVRGPRAQADRALYKDAMRALVGRREGLDILEGEVADLLLSGEEVVGVQLADATEITACSVVLTSGTFLNGVIHIGDRKISGGRMGACGVTRLADRIRGFGLRMGRLKTGTPPRLDGRSIRWDGLERQPGDEEPVFFSTLTESVATRQVACGITHTTPRTHDIIRKNIGRSAMYGGHIASKGPRYCPSIEDKVTRFSEKPSHQIFLEPEGLTDTTVYPNGVSTSLPEEVQEDFIRSIPGLENVRILRPGYAIAYDYVDPRSLRRTLELHDLDGLFLAGQINGTTGYEEAAGQGLVAGLNAAARALQAEPIIFERTRSYIGVMVDDLITQGVSEPYRMFTSRAEHRLSLRADNADRRLTPVGERLGVISDVRREAYRKRMARLGEAEAVLDAIKLPAARLHRAGIRVSESGPARSAREAFGLPGATVEALTELAPEIRSLDGGAVAQLANDALYAHYVQRQSDEVARLRRDEAVTIPRDVSFDDIAGLSTELTERLRNARPETLGQAARLEGMTPAALTLIYARVRWLEKSSA